MSERAIDRLDHARQLAAQLVELGQARVRVREWGVVQFGADGTAFVEAVVEVPPGTVIKSAEEVLAEALELEELRSAALEE